VPPSSIVWGNSGAAWTTASLLLSKRNNIYAVDYNGNIVWNIKEIVGKDECWVAAILNIDNELITSSFSGGRYVIDPKLKKVITFKYTK